MAILVGHNEETGETGVILTREETRAVCNILANVGSASEQVQWARDHGWGWSYTLCFVLWNALGRPA